MANAKATKEGKVIEEGTFLSDSEQISTGDTVSVACKLPHGLILRVFNAIEKDVPVMGGGFKTEKATEPRAEVYTVYGWAHPQNAAPHCTIIGNYAITHNIPKGHWELWLSQNKNSDMVKNGLIFANEKYSMVQGQAREMAGEMNGFKSMQRIDPENLPKKIETSELMRKAA